MPEYEVVYSEGVIYRKGGLTDYENWCVIHTDRIQVLIYRRRHHMSGKHECFILNPMGFVSNICIVASNNILDAIVTATAMIDQHLNQGSAP
jgi:hypothetical protein